MQLAVTRPAVVQRLVVVDIAPVTYTAHGKSLTFEKYVQYAECDGTWRRAVYVCMYMYICVCMYICLYVCICICVYCMEMGIDHIRISCAIS